MTLYASIIIQMNLLLLLKISNFKLDFLFDTYKVLETLQDSDRFSFKVKDNDKHFHSLLEYEFSTTVSTPRED